MHVVHTSEGWWGKITVAAHCRFLGQAEQKNGQQGQVSADIEHSLDKLNTRLEKTKMGMQMFNSTKFETKIIIMIIIIIIIIITSFATKPSHNNSISKNSEIRI
jgi:hypothetical protein